jgi:PAS domain S-box-containing protein
MSDVRDAEAWRRRFEREREARKQAEALLHDKSRELFDANIALGERAAELDRHARRERALGELSMALARSSSREAFVALLREEAPRLLGLDRLSLVERRSGDQVEMTPLFRSAPQAERWTTPGAPGASPISMAVSILRGSALAEAMERGEVVATPRRSVEEFHDWQLLRDQTGLRHFAVVPLMESTSVLGTLNAGWNTEPLPSEDRLALVEQLAAVVAAHLRGLRAREQLAIANEALELTVEQRTQELRLSEERFVLLFEYAPQPMLMVDAANMIMQVNRGAAALFGYAEEDLVGRLVEDLIPRERRSGHEHLMRGFREQHRAAGARRMGGRAVPALRRDGSTFVAEIQLAAVEIEGAPFTLVGVTDVTDMTRTQSALRQSLEEKVTLLKEIHHRVKNNLQIISSLLFLQQEGLPSDAARTALQESVFRVRSMALIHQALYGVESLDRVDLYDYAQRLGGTLQSTLAPRARLTVLPSTVVVGIDAAVPVGLILNELVTNALKYGVPPPERGDVQAHVVIEVTESETHYEMRVRDNGPGLTQNPLTSGGRVGLGLQLVKSLTRQLRGTLDVEPGEGTTFHLRWPRVTLPPPATS